MQSLYVLSQEVQNYIKFENMNCKFSKTLNLKICQKLDGQHDYWLEPTVLSNLKHNLKQ